MHSTLRDATTPYTNVSNHYEEKQNEKSMLKFFRKIRQKLINEGNLKRYIIYAIGEIMLVMIGILLALQVNSWNDIRQAKIDEIRDKMVEEIEEARPDDLEDPEEVDRAAL